MRLFHSVKVCLAYRNTVIMTQDALQVPVVVWGDGANCCSVLREQSPHNFFQVLRNRGHSHRDYARVKI
jgi:hypothetical protein